MYNRMIFGMRDYMVYDDHDNYGGGVQDRITILFYTVGYCWRIKQIEEEQTAI